MGLINNGSMDTTLKVQSTSCVPIVRGLMPGPPLAREHETSRGSTRWVARRKSTILQPRTTIAGKHVHIETQGQSPSLTDSGGEETVVSPRLSHWPVTAHINDIKAILRQRRLAHRETLSETKEIAGTWMDDDGVPISAR